MQRRDVGPGLLGQHRRRRSRRGTRCTAGAPRDGSADGLASSQRTSAPAPASSSTSRRASSSERPGATRTLTPRRAARRARRCARRRPCASVTVTMSWYVRPSTSTGSPRARGEADERGRGLVDRVLALPRPRASAPAGRGRRRRRSSSRRRRRARCRRSARARRRSVGLAEQAGRRSTRVDAVVAVRPLLAVVEDVATSRLVAPAKRSRSREHHARRRPSCRRRRGRRCGRPSTRTRRRPASSARCRGARRARRPVAVAAGARDDGSCRDALVDDAERRGSGPRRGRRGAPRRRTPTGESATQRLRRRRRCDPLKRRPSSRAAPR